MYATRTSHLTFHWSLPVDERNLSLLRTTSRCIQKAVSCLDSLRARKPIPSRGGQVPRTTTRISENVDCRQPTSLFLPPSTAKAGSTVCQGTYTRSGTVKHPGSIAFSSPLSRKIRRTMTTTTTLSTYLLEQKKRFLGDNGDGWTVVMGNEAGGMPSSVTVELLQS